MAKNCPTTAVHLTYRFDEEGEMSHSSFWRHWGAAAVVADAWQMELRVDTSKLAEDLEELKYAFPRGRVTRVGRTYRVYHGNSLRPLMRISRRQIERVFGIRNQCRWEFDELERCLTEDKQAIRRCLNIEEDWPSE